MDLPIQKFKLCAPIQASFTDGVKGQKSLMIPFHREPNSNHFQPPVAMLTWRIDPMYLRQPLWLWYSLPSSSPSLSFTLFFIKQTETNFKYLNPCYLAPYLTQPFLFKLILERAGRLFDTSWLGLQFLSRPSYLSFISYLLSGLLSDSNTYYSQIIIASLANLLKSRLLLEAEKLPSLFLLPFGRLHYFLMLPWWQKFHKCSFFLECEAVGGKRHTHDLLNIHLSRGCGIKVGASFKKGRESS